MSFLSLFLRNFENDHIQIFEYLQKSKSRIGQGFRKQQKKYKKKKRTVRRTARAWSDRVERTGLKIQ
jgi:hypothetical protein